MAKFTSTKVFDGFSTVFRQWKAEDTHCRFLHGYGVSFKLWFEGQLDNRNWVWDFGGMKRAKGKIDGRSPKEWMDYMFDHTLVLASDDPHKDKFEKLPLTSLGKDSVFEICEDLNIKIIGLSTYALTQFHRYEEINNVPYRYFKNFTGKFPICTSKSRT